MIKSLKSDNLKLVYTDGIIRLYQVGEGNKKPIIFINDQMEHRVQNLEASTDLTRKTCYQYANYFMYDDNVHTPCIMVYNYPIRGVDKSFYTIEAFVNSLNTAMAENSLEQVDLIGIGTGGVIASYASSNERVDQVRAIHPSLLSTPLANLDLLHDYYSSLNIKEKMIYRVLKTIIDPQFGFQRQNAQGYLDCIDKMALEKIIIWGSTINGFESADELSKTLSEMIYKISHQDSDGVVCHNKDLLTRYGFEVREDPLIKSHFDLKDYMYTTSIYGTLLTRTLKK